MAHGASYPPSLWQDPPPTGLPATGAIAGKPGKWLQPGDTPPPDFESAEMALVVDVTPATSWEGGTHMRLGDGQHIYWGGAGVGWVTGDSPVLPPISSNPSTGATEGNPATWTPAGTDPPRSKAELVAGVPVAVVATPATAWTGYVQVVGANGYTATWNGTAWV